MTRKPRNPVQGCVCLREGLPTAPQLCRRLHACTRLAACSSTLVPLVFFSVYIFKMQQRGHSCRRYIIFYKQHYQQGSRHGAQAEVDRDHCAPSSIKAALGQRAPF